MSHFAVNPDVASTLLHDAVNRGQAKSCSLAHLFGCEKWLENPAASGLVHADTIVTDRQQHVAVRVHSGMLTNKTFIEIEHTRFNDELAASRHGIARIHRQIQDDLVDLSGIC